MFESEDDYLPSVAQLASEADRLWFSAHPDRSHRLRQALVGELPGITPKHRVVIRQVNRLLRLRWPLLYDEPLPMGDAPEWVARDMFERVAGEQMVKVRAFEELVNAQPAIKKELARFAEKWDADHPLLPHPDPDRPADA
jgi:hypothetical protein